MHFAKLLGLIIPLVSAASYSAFGQQTVQPFLDQYCADCHDAEMKKGGLDLASITPMTSEAGRVKKWVRIFDRVAAGEMPPAKKTQPTAEELQDFMATLGAGLVQHSKEQRSTVLRRLNRQEYQNTLQDLLGVKVDLISRLPEDGRAQGFDTVGEALSISGIQMQRYLEAAELALNAAISQIERPEVIKERVTYALPSLEANLKQHWLKRPDGAVVFFNNGGFPSTQLPGWKAKAAGVYRLRVMGYAYQMQESAVFSVIGGSFNRGGDTQVHGYLELPPGRAQGVEMHLPLRAGDSLKLSPLGLNGPDGHSPTKDGPSNYPGEGLAVQWVEVEGPLLEEWPPRGRHLLLGDAVVTEVMPEKAWLRKKPGYVPKLQAKVTNPEERAKKQLPLFLTAAFRRNVSEEEVLPYLNLFEEEMAASGDFLIAMRTAASAALCSPDFLFLRDQPGRLTSSQLASRLSYFLTRSAPDARLMQADQTQPKARREQVERLLKAATLERFVADFTDGWLNLREIDFTTPDKLLYPEFDELLQDSMLKETRHFIRVLIEENLRLQNLIESDFAMLNARLARHYEIPGVQGLMLRKVALPPGSHRGGLLAQASILKVSANGTNTSPVVRGVWVMDRLLGLEPPPPPPGVPGVEPDIRGATTLREQLDKHRDSESCNGCHKHIDPPGFALENYDVIGGWRERFRTLEKGENVALRVEGRKVRYKLGPPVDATGVLSRGGAFSNLDELKKILLQDPEPVTRCVVEKLLTFATGRAMSFADRGEIEKLVREATQRGYGLRDVIHLLVESEIFLEK